MSESIELSVDAARERLLARLPAARVVDTTLDAADGRVLAQDVNAHLDSPAFTNAAMDGYALRAHDVHDVPTTLRVVTTIPAGRSDAVKLSDGDAARIMTGAPIPSGADCVVRFEDTDEIEPRARGNAVEIRRMPVAGQHVRPAGEDVRAGAVLLRAGTLLDPLACGALAAQGIRTVPVYASPRVTLIATGDEVVGVGQALAHGQVYDANTPLLQAAIVRAGGVVTTVGMSSDSAADLRRAFSAPGAADLIITTGGVSVGDFDTVKQVLAADGEVEFWKVQMRPGHHIAFGLLDGTPILGLPGNPIAAWIAFLQFGVPALHALRGLQRRGLPQVAARITTAVTAPGPRRHFVRATLAWEAGGWQVTPLAVHGSALLASSLAANALLVVPEGSDGFQPGDVAQVQVLDPVAAIYSASIPA